MPDDATPSPGDQRASRFLLGLLAVLAAVSVFLIAPFLTGTLFALVLGYLLQGPYKRLQRRVRSSALAAGIVLLVVTIAIVAPVLFVSYQLVQDAGVVLARFQSQGDVEDVIAAFLEGVGIPRATAEELIANALAQGAALIQSGVLPTLTALAAAAANVGVFLFLLYFVLVGGEDLARYVRASVPLEEERARHLMDTIGGTVRALFVGTFLVAIIQGTFAAVGWWLFGFPGPIFWGFVMTLLAVLPVAGPFLVMLPAGIIAILQGDTFSGVGLIVYGLVVVSMVDNVARPYVVSRGSDIHPGVVLVGTLGGLIVFGTTGFIIGPLVLSMFAPILNEWKTIRPGPG